MPREFKDSDQAIGQLARKIPYHLSTTVSAEIKGLFSKYFSELFHKFGASNIDINPNELLDNCVTQFIGLLFSDDYFDKVDPSTGMIIETDYQDRIAVLLNIFENLGIKKFVAENNLMSKLLEQLPFLLNEIRNLHSEVDGLKQDNESLSSELRQLRSVPSSVDDNPLKSDIRGAILDIAASGNFDFAGPGLAEKFSDALSTGKDFSIFAVDIENLAELVPNKTIDKIVERKPKLLQAVHIIIEKFIKSLQANDRDMDIIFWPEENRFFVSIASSKSKFALFFSLKLSEILRENQNVRKGLREILNSTEVPGGNGSVSPTFRSALIDVSPSDLENSSNEFQLIALDPRVLEMAAMLSLDGELAMADHSKPGIVYNHEQISSVPLVELNSHALQKSFARVFDILNATGILPELLSRPVGKIS
jgi:hypothetical protein